MEFKKARGAEKAVNARGTRIGGRVVFVDYDDGAPKRSFRAESGRHYYKEKEQGGRGGGGGGGHGGRR